MSEQHGTENFEASDWQIKPVVIAGIAVMVFLAIGVVFGYVTERLCLVAIGDSSEEQVFTTKREFLGPRLQTDEPADLKLFHDREDEQLSRYELIDKERGRVRIPIDRAIELVAEEGARP